jgi:hypothetical protein
MHSIVHDDFLKDRVVIFNLDLEHSGNEAGIVQLSVVAFDASDSAVRSEFSEYVKPPQNARWSTKCMEIHGIHPTQERIKNAGPIEAVWPRFVEFIESRLENGKKNGIIAAWGGETCDCEWLFRIVHETHRGRLFLPRWCPYFMDPMKVISHYKGCKLHESRRPVSQQGNSLDVVWCFINGKTELAGAHSSLIDARAQADIVADKRFVMYMDKPESIKAIDEIWMTKRKKRDSLEAELTRTVPEGWEELPENERWSLPRNKRYEGAEGGGYYGPTSQVLRACESRSLVDLFLFFFPWPLLSDIAQATNQYGNEEWVRPHINDNSDDGSSTKDEKEEDSIDNVLDDADDADDVDDSVADADDVDDADDADDSVAESNKESRYDNSSDDDSHVIMNDEDYHVAEVDEGMETSRKGWKKMLVPCDASHQDARKRCNGPWVHVTASYVLIFLATLMYRGALNIHSVNFFWSEEYNEGIAWIKNAITRDAFRQIRQFIHFVNNGTLPTKQTDPRWHPLQKVKHVMDSLGERLRMGWTLGKKFCVDESMIKYMGKAVSWVQYMPKKPIKHGLKVFALCCAYTGYLYCYEVYTGKENTDGSPKAVIERLMLMAGVTFVVRGKGRVLYTDNFYTSMEVMQHVFDRFGVLMVGTYALKKKKSRTAADFPFDRLSKTCMDTTTRGWMRDAVKCIFKGTKLLYKVQATVWKDKKEVGFLHNHLVSVASEDKQQVWRFDRAKAQKVKIDSPQVVLDYQKHMNGVDCKDRDTADWGISIKTNRYYLRLFFWQVDNLLHAMYCIIVFLARDNKDDPWHKYCSKNGGREKFQKDLAQALIAYAIRKDWKHVEDETAKPAYMRKVSYVPCGCKTCFFCQEGLTHGIDHRYRGHNIIPQMDSCPTERKTISKYPERCRVCYEECRARNPQSHFDDVDKLCHKTRKGCSYSQVHVCDTHWEAFPHDNKENK